MLIAPLQAGAYGANRILRGYCDPVDADMDSSVALLPVGIMPAMHRVDVLQRMYGGDVPTAASRAIRAQLPQGQGALEKH